MANEEALSRAADGMRQILEDLGDPVGQPGTRVTVLLTRTDEAGHVLCAWSSELDADELREALRRC